MAGSLTKRWPILHFWKFFLGVGMPLALSPIPIYYQTKVACAAYTMALMAGFWMSEVVPTAVTALLPVVLYPMFGIQESGVLASEYLKDSIQVFIGGLMVALTFEFCNLHKRVALRVMLFTGTSMAKLMLGIMLTTMFLSMWMSNTATTAMMCPIICAILEELLKSLREMYADENVTQELQDGLKGLEDVMNLEVINTLDTIDAVLEERDHSEPSSASTSTPVTFDEGGIDPNVNLGLPSNEQSKSLNESIHSMKTMFLLSTCYSSNIGGSGVITGSGTNLVALEFLGNLDPKHHGEYASVTFTTWMAFAVIPMLLNVLIAWVYLQLVFMGIPNQIKFWKSREERQRSNSLINPRIETKIKRMLERKYKELGSFSLHEKLVIGLFIFIISAWITHNPKFISGWKSWFPHTSVGISSVSLLVTVLFFSIPRNKEFYMAFWKRDFTGVEMKPLLEMDFVLKRFPWGVMLLLGGGYALSNGSKAAGLSSAIGKSLANLSTFPPALIQLMVMTLIGFLTEVTSNSATASILIPILLEMSKEINVHPLYLALPATITCSYAFMLPVATPSNAIVYAASGDMRVSDMIKVGFFMNCVCICVLYLTTNLYGNLIFHFNEYNYVP